MKVRLDPAETEETVSWNTAVHMIGSILSGAHHTFEIKTLFISGKEKSKFVDDYLKLADRKGSFSNHYSGRLKTMRDRVRKGSSILVVGMKQLARPDGIDCNLCGFPSCRDFFKFHEFKKYSVLCPVELMTFGGSVSRGLQTAAQLGVATVLTQSLGRAALKLKLINADFAMGIILEIGQAVKTPKENKMAIGLRPKNPTGG